MAWGRSNEQWNHTASLMTMLASIHGDPDAPQKPCLAMFHPYLPEPEMPTMSAESLATVLRAAGLSRRKEPAE